MHQTLAWLALILPPFAFAQSSNQESTTSVKIESVRSDQNTVDGNIDDDITNAKLRAESGSRSKFSVSATTDFKGGTVDAAFGTNRPQLVAEPGKQDNTSIDAGVGLRVRWNRHDSLTLGTNFGLNTPFQGHVDSAQPQFNVYDPEVAYNRVGKLGRVQSNGKIGLSPGTSSQSRDVDRVATLAASNVFVYAFDTKVTTGLALEGVYNQHGSAPGGNAALNAQLKQTYDHYYGGDARTGYALGIFPYVEYAFSDRYQLRTVFGYFNFRHLYGDDKTARLLRQSAFQSVGLGIALTRDVYVYPNLQFIPDDVRVDRTNVAFNAQLNIF